MSTLEDLAVGFELRLHGTLSSAARTEHIVRSHVKATSSTRLLVLCKDTRTAMIEYAVLKTGTGIRVRRSSEVIQNLSDFG